MSTPDSAAEREPMIEETRVEVTLQRSVRYGPVIIGAAILGAVLGLVVSFMFPVAEDAEYTMGQIIGFTVLIGGVIGLCLGGILTLVLSFVARRKRGRGVAIQADVR